MNAQPLDKLTHEGFSLPARDGGMRTFTGEALEKLNPSPREPKYVSKFSPAESIETILRSLLWNRFLAPSRMNAEI